MELYDVIQENESLVDLIDLDEN